jgi:hypothetical protein
MPVAPLAQEQFADTSWIGLMRVHVRESAC